SMPSWDGTTPPSWASTCSRPSWCWPVTFWLTSSTGWRTRGSATSDVFPRNGVALRNDEEKATRVASSIAQKNRSLVRWGVRPAGERYSAQVVRRFLRRRLAVTGLVVLILMSLAALAAPLLAPHDPNAMDLFAFSAPPSVEHPLGTDSLGRDVLSRLLFASRISLSVGLGATLINVVVGVLLGGLAGYLGGKVDSAIMRFTDMILSFPPLMIILVLVSVLGPSLMNVILVLGLLGWPQICRLVRAEILKLKEQDFIQAARALGVPDGRILLRHLIPNAFPPVLVAATFGAAQAIIQEASLSFLGIGV